MEQSTAPQIEENPVINEISEGLYRLILKRLKTPLVKGPPLKLTTRFHTNTKQQGLTHAQIGEVSLLIFNELNKILGRPELEDPQQENSTPEIDKTVETTMKSVHKILSMPPPIPAICKQILAKVLDRCEELISEHSLSPEEIKQIGTKTWEKVSTTIFPDSTNQT